MKAASGFQRRVRQAIGDRALQTALDNNAARRRGAWGPAFASLADSEAVRREARRIRQDVVENLRDYVEEFIHHLGANGISVHLAPTAEEARRQVLAIAQASGAAFAVKAKSMLTEEIGLNKAFEAAGIRPIESDLGEFIVQLRGEKPTHIITPAVHLRREQIAETLQTHLNMPYSLDVEAMTAAARSRLRADFLAAPIAVTGVNFGVASSGTLCLVENEGNIRMAATVAPVHVAVMGLERLVPDFESLAVMLQVLPRAATGQSLTSYVSWINSPAGRGDFEGPHERHLVLVDNGRLEMADSLIAEALLCIRCGACLNACPVFQEIGGAAYGSVYPGPIGSLISPSLFAEADFGHLAKASTLCGACTEVCPVGVDFPTLLHRRRVEYVQQVRQPIWLRTAVRVYAYAAASPTRFRRAQRLASRAGWLLPRRRGWLAWLPGPLGSWTKHRHFPPAASRPFRARWEAIRPEASASMQPSEPLPAASSQAEPATIETLDLVSVFQNHLEQVGGELRFVARADLASELSGVLSEIRSERVLVSRLELLGFEFALEELEAAGIELVSPEVDVGAGPRELLLDSIASVPAGLTRAAAALADTGTLVQPGGPSRSLLASLLPEVHIAVLDLEDIYTDMAAWLAGGGEQQARRSPNLVFITGPSRTADIEMTLTIGVHGPKRLVVLGVK